MDKVKRRRFVLFLLYLKKRKEKRNLKKKSQRRFWVHPILQLRQQQGDWSNLILEMGLQEDETFFNYMRMTPTMFDTLLSKIGPAITKMETSWRTPIPAAARLAMTIRYLATGDGLQSIAYCYCIGRSTTSQIIKETCNAI